MSWWLYFCYLFSQIHRKDLHKHEDALKDITGNQYGTLREKLSKCLEKDHLINECDLSSGVAVGKQMDKVILAALKKGISFCVLLTSFKLRYSMVTSLVGPSQTRPVTPRHHKGPVTRVPHRPTQEKRMTSNAWETPLTLTKEKNSTHKQRALRNDERPFNAYAALVWQGLKTALILYWYQLKRKLETGLWCLWCAVCNRASSIIVWKLTFRDPYLRTFKRHFSHILNSLK